jgi:hypothetical protein
VSYRFDPPQSDERGARMAISAGSTGIQRPERLGSHAPAEPHILRRTARESRGASPILPRSDPFAIPSARLHERLAPVLHFLFLFALFTAAGTWILTTSRRTEPNVEFTEPASAAAQPSLEPQTLTAPSNKIIEPPTSTPTAAGPLGTMTPRTGLRATPDGRPADDNPQATTARDAAAPRVADAGSQPLPRARTRDLEQAGGGDAPARRDGPAREDGPDVGPDEAPSAVARLTGSILSAPTQQAHHDDQRSSLH